MVTWGCGCSGDTGDGGGDDNDDIDGGASEVDVAGVVAVYRWNRYALSFNADQFWSTAVAKTINREEQIHARVDGKKVIISEASIRRDIYFGDEEGVDCLPNSTIFEQLTSMGSVTSQNGLLNHERKYISPSHTKKIFGNTKRIGKGFSGRITSLFQTMVVQSQLGEGSEVPTNPYHTSTILQKTSSQPQKTHKPRKPTRKVTQVPQPSDLMEHVADEAVHKELGDKLVRAATTASSLEVEQDSEKRRKIFAAKRAEDKRNKPPTQAQQRKIICTYLKNMEGNKLKDLKNKSFDYIQKMYDRAFKRVNKFVDFRAELVEGSSKREGEELIQESTKKQKVEDDKKIAKLKQLMEIIPDEEEVAIDVIPLAVKSQRIVD
uniref:Uncharacterized protein n=1 Tax=Tanacetum cinerariifolium TaxID=118510 RepID=A0A699GPN1_TANCI|nr:hypothetical protein [Tanacetum cinerariifolium]